MAKPLDHDVEFGHNSDEHHYLLKKTSKNSSWLLLLQLLLQLLQQLQTSQRYSLNYKLQLQLQKITYIFRSIVQFPSVQMLEISFTLIVVFL